jgi:hypothetical protein
LCRSRSKRTRLLATIKKALRRSIRGRQHRQPAHRAAGRRGRQRRIKNQCGLAGDIQRIQGIEEFRR